MLPDVATQYRTQCYAVVKNPPRVQRLLQICERGHGYYE